MDHDTRPTTARAAAGAVPAAMPVLSRGRHRSPRTGACFMEMASFLAGERWSDHPACTHPLLAQLARDVNDRTSDAARARLGLLVPSVVGLHDDDPATDARLALLCARRALPVAAQERQHALAVSLLTGEDALARLEGRPADDCTAATRAVLEQVPLAAAWARRFVTATRGVGAPSRSRSGPRGAREDDRAVRAYRRHGAPFAVTCSAAGIASAVGTDPDAALHDLLADAVALVAGSAGPPAPTGRHDDVHASDRWAEACRLTAAGRR
ncbi:hypothetical protein [uncultured Pseudokineococcus sp.]|uniref:hypothetical protein n=1 Tax=uncultured Pseudokineococcus sp. TaxID=1642928 RepID=UPI00262615AA|nr:hypothetical protein [uncultured Pseudokineococcus sp.]